ncbi:hypothetical protein HPB50_010997 [Hyalomma asiaticum]|uniref:Uncharacterized protein n=1 Tax=Hyalomma asiaticum TaxID=266040 RepID=A0ACB7TFY6_HYAAI|nr:hypothetical protein HPB50_010997 [Hyalomma asiaticum]
MGCESEEDRSPLVAPQRHIWPVIMSDSPPTAAAAARKVEFNLTPSSEGGQDFPAAVSVTTPREPEAGPSKAVFLKYSDRPTSNHVMDCVLAEFRARPVVHERLGNVPLPDFRAGDARITSPRFCNLHAVFREGDAYMRASPYTPGHLPDEIRLRSRVSCRDATFQSDFAYSYFNGRATLRFRRILIGVQLVLKGGLPEVRSLQVDDIGEVDVVSLAGVPIVLKWLAGKIIKKLIRNNGQLIARLASNEVKDVLQEAIDDEDLGSVLKDALATEQTTLGSSGKRKSSS